MARFLLPDANAFGVVAIGAKGGCACRAHPFVAPLVAALLFFEPLFEGFHQFFKPTQGVDFGFFFRAQMLFRHFAQPVFGQINRLDHRVVGYVV